MFLDLQALPQYAGKLGYLLIGDGTQPLTPAGRVGELCLGGGSHIARYAADTVTLDASGHASTNIANSVTAGPGFGIPGTGGASIMPGDTWNFAYWYRRGKGESGFSSTASILFQ